MKSISLLIGIVAFFAIDLQAQVSLKPGDELPDITLQDVKNYPTNTLRIADLRGKLVIFDFWTVTCGGCITAMPEMEALQEQFKDRIQIILVTNSTQEQVERLAKRSSIVKNVKLPMVIADSVLTKLFIFRTVPTHVWIDEKGIVNQFTGPFSTSETVGDYVKGKTVNLPIKKEYRDFNPHVSLFEEGEGRQRKHVKYYSSIFERIDDDGGFSTSKIDTVENTYRRTIINYPVLYLYQYAYAVPGVFVPDMLNSRVVLETSNNDRFKRPSANDAYGMIRFERDNSHCYESVLPLEKRNQAQEVMKRDLELYFGLKARKEIRKTKCLVVRCRDSSLLLQEGSRFFPQSAANFFDQQLENKLIEQGVPVINELGYEGEVNIRFEHGSSDREGLISELESYGITVHWEDREIEMLVVTD